MPAVGLAVPADHAEAALGLIEPLRALGPAHLVCRLRCPPRATTPASPRPMASSPAHSAAELVLEVVLPCVDAEGKPTDDLERAAARPRPM